MQVKESSVSAVQTRAHSVCMCSLWKSGLQSLRGCGREMTIRVQLEWLCVDMVALLQLHRGGRRGIQEEDAHTDRKRN